MAPQFTTISTPVEKDSTSTMITTSLIGAKVATPCSPHSKRISNSCWSKVIVRSLCTAVSTQRRQGQRSAGPRQGCFQLLALDDADTPARVGDEGQSHRERRKSQRPRLPPLAHVVGCAPATGHPRRPGWAARIQDRASGLDKLARFQSTKRAPLAAKHILSLRRSPCVRFTPSVWQSASASIKMGSAASSQRLSASPRDRNGVGSAATVCQWPSFHDPNTSANHSSCTSVWCTASICSRTS